jgi:hypothetical protein
VTVAGKRTATSYLLQGTFAHAGIETFVETRDLPQAPTDAQVRNAVNGFIDDMEAARVFGAWAAANMVGRSATLSGWTGTVSAVTTDCHRRAVTFSVTLAKGVATRVLSYDCITRTQGVAVVGAELLAWVTQKQQAIAAAQAPVDDSTALAGVSQ